MARAAVACFDRTGSLAWANPAFEALFSGPAGASLSAVLDRLLAGTEAAAEAADVRRRLEQGESLTVGRSGTCFTVTLGDGAAAGEFVLTVARSGPAPDIPLRLPLDGGMDRRAVLDTALDAMSDALCCFDESLRLILWNRRYVEMFRLPPTLMRVGTPFATLLEHCAVRGDYGPGVPAELVAERLERCRSGEAHGYRYSMADGRLLDVRHSPLPGGGFLRVFSDLTDRWRSEAAQRQILEAISFPLVVTRLSDGLVLAVNEPASELFGVSAADVVGRMVAWDAYALSGDRDLMLARLTAEGGRIDAFETRLRASGDRLFWVLISVRLFSYEGQAALLACVNDISRRRAAEEELAAQWERSRAVLEGLSQGVMAFDHSLCLTAWNRRVLALLGLPDGFCRFRQPLEEITRYVAAQGGYGPGDVERIVSERLAYVRGPLPRRNERVRPDGVIIETLTQGLPDGGFVTTYTDVTERKRAEQELADSRNLFEMAIRAARDGISQMDLGRGTVWFSPQWWSLLGYGEDEMVNTIERWSELILPEDRVTTARYAARFTAGEIDECQFLQRFVHKQGHIVHLFTRAIRVVDDGRGGVRLVGSHTDMTERIRAEEAARAATAEAERALRELKEAQAHLVQSEKMAALGSLVAGVAHEVNTPIGIAVTGASLLAERTQAMRRVLEGRQLRRQDLVDFIDTCEEASQLLLFNTQRAAELIQSFKQIAVDQASGERRAFDLSDYIHEVLRSIGVRLRRSAHTVEVSCPEGLVLDGYPGALGQVLTNFVMNSITHAYGPGEHGRLRIEVICPSGDEVELRYSDDGRGIPPEVQHRVFEPFFTTNRALGGSGLGLNIVYNIATRTLQGRITLESGPERGTLFVLRFPRVVPDGGAA